MMNTDDFVEEYMDECIENGIMSPKDMCSSALEEKEALSSEIDKLSVEINEKRERLNGLNAVLRNFNHDSVKKPRKNEPSILVNTDVSHEDLDPFHQDILVKICSVISEKNSATPREIMNSVGGIERNKEAYMAIKRLCETGVISRNDNRSLIKGPNWSERPKTT